MPGSEERDPYGVEFRSVAGRAVVVTGGTTGIGRAVARLLASRGARVLVFGRHREELDEALEELRREGGEAHGLVADVSRMDDVRRVFREADERLGGIDVLVNNAAVTGGGFEGEALDEIEYVVRTNVAGYVACAREAVERMKRRGEGHVVNVGSMSADLREPEGSVYVATKGAIQAFSESLRKTVNPGGIKVTLIEPGKVATDMVEMPDAEKREKEEALEMLRPEDVAACVYFALVQPRRCDVVALQVRPHLQVI
ncbi:MAG TPA: SDR family oxidoreductase [Longimicrobiaceae bacterium]|nr:SDR family oxidoreductase [Longimicrobiaceae bacterium]